MFAARTPSISVSSLASWTSGTNPNSDEFRYLELKLGYIEKRETKTTMEKKLYRAVADGVTHLPVTQ
uniref:Uncharacterized protein n=1 Tax=Arundo donax TaxID=35708 RepID=A0A0A9DUK4_ARUDO